MPQIRQRHFLVTTADVTSPSAPTTPDPWAAVTAVILGAQGRFSGGLAVEVLTLAGVVYSRNVGGFTTATYAPVASAIEDGERVGVLTPHRARNAIPTALHHWPTGLVPAEDLEAALDPIIRVEPWHKGLSTDA